MYVCSVGRWSSLQGPGSLLAHIWDRSGCSAWSISCTFSSLTGRVEEFPSSAPHGQAVADQVWTLSPQCAVPHHPHGQQRCPARPGAHGPVWLSEVPLPGPLLQDAEQVAVYVHERLHG